MINFIKSVIYVNSDLRNLYYENVIIKMISKFEDFQEPNSG